MRAVIRMVSVVLCCAAVVPAIAEAKVKPTPTQMTFLEADLDSIGLELSSPSKKCLRERTLIFVDLDTGLIFLRPCATEASRSH